MNNYFLKIIAGFILLTTIIFSSSYDNPADFHSGQNYNDLNSRISLGFTYGKISNPFFDKKVLSDVGLFIKHYRKAYRFYPFIDKIFIQFELNVKLSSQKSDEYQVLMFTPLVVDLGLNFNFSKKTSVELYYFFSFGLGYAALNIVKDFSDDSEIKYKQTVYPRFRFGVEFFLVRERISLLPEIKYMFVPLSYETTYHKKHFLNIGISLTFYFKGNDK